MFGLDDKYKVDRKMPLKDFIPKDIKPADKKKIKDNVKSCTLTYQIMGEDIPSVVDSQNHVQVIQFYDFELEDIKKATFVANLYQTIIKSPCVLRLYDNTKEVYSFALKRLNHNDNTQIVVTDTLITNEYFTSINDGDRRKFESHLKLNSIIAKQNKVTFYLEMYVKAYILSKDRVYTGATAFLEDKHLWYSESKVRDTYANLRALELLKLSLVKASGNAEKMRINKEIKSIISKIEL